jgi:hypothetical protein
MKTLIQHRKRADFLRPELGFQPSHPDPVIPGTRDQRDQLRFFRQTEPAFTVDAPLVPRLGNPPSGIQAFLRMKENRVRERRIFQEGRRQAGVNPQEGNLPFRQEAYLVHEAENVQPRFRPDRRALQNPQRARE